MSTGEGAGTAFATSRGRDWPSVRQFNVFLENRVGALLNVVRPTRKLGQPITGPRAANLATTPAPSLEIQTTSRAIDVSASMFSNASRRSSLT